MSADPRRPPTDWRPFLARIEQFPQESGPISVWADFLGEQCHPWEEPLRWAVAAGRTPYRGNRYFKWYRRGAGDVGRITLSVNPHCLPSPLFRYTCHGWVHVVTAWQSLCEGWYKMPAADRAALLAAPVPQLLF